MHYRGYQQASYAALAVQTHEYVILVLWVGQLAPTIAVLPSGLVMSALSKQSTMGSTLTYLLPSTILLLLLAVFEGESGDPKVRLFIKSFFLFSSLLYKESIHCTSIQVSSTSFSPKSLPLSSTHFGMPFSTVSSSVSHLGHLHSA